MTAELRQTVVWLDAMLTLVLLKLVLVDAD